MKKLVDELLGFGLFRGSSFFAFFVVLLGFWLESNDSSTDQYSLFFKDSWRNFGRALMLGELMSNELGSASIYSGLMKKSTLATSTLEDT
jgi:hypothetical protein